MKLLRQCDGMVNGVHRDDTSQKIFHDTVIKGIRLYQLICHAQYAGLAKCLFIFTVVATLHTCQRKEGCTTEAIVLQVGNEFLRSLLILGDNILYIAAQSGLHRRLIFFFYLHKVCYHTVNTGDLILFLHDAAHTAAVTLVSFRDILQRLQT